MDPGTGLANAGTANCHIGRPAGSESPLGKGRLGNEVLPTGEELVIRAAAESTDSAVLPIAPVLAEATFRGVAESIRLTGSPVQLTLGDGDAVLEITEVKNSEEAVARVRTGGAVRSRMGFTAKGVELDVDVFTEKDKKDLEVLLRHGVTYVGVSFVRNAEDIRRIRRYISDVLGIDRYIPIISKSSGLSP